jgi:hypothetical protein
MRSLSVIDRNIETTHMWVNDLAEELETVRFPARLPRPQGLPTR